MFLFCRRKLQLGVFKDRPDILVRQPHFRRACLPAGGQGKSRLLRPIASSTLCLVTPTSLQWRDRLGVDDYRKKEMNKKGKAKVALPNDSELRINLFL